MWCVIVRCVQKVIYDTWFYSGDPPCQNNGSCYQGQCLCSEIFTGETCETGRSLTLSFSCFLKCCSFHATSFSTVPSALVTCKRTPCTHMPPTPSARGVPCGGYYCFNNGSCVSGSYCDCVSPYSGTYCSYIECKWCVVCLLDRRASNCSMFMSQQDPPPSGVPPCQNGSCYSGVCSCYDGYTGSSCETGEQHGWKES